MRCDTRFPGKRAAAQLLVQVGAENRASLPRCFYSKDLETGSWETPSLLQTEHKRLLHVEMLFQIDSCMLHGGITIHIASRWRFTRGVGDGFWAKPNNQQAHHPELNSILGFHVPWGRLFWRPVPVSQELFWAHRSLSSFIFRRDWAKYRRWS